VAEVDILFQLGRELTRLDERFSTNMTTISSTLEELLTLPKKVEQLQQDVMDLRAKLQVLEKK
jgi:predicted  nucleic acid-binding Zn-ribbon protein